MTPPSWQDSESFFVPLRRIIAVANAPAVELDSFTLQTEVEILSPRASTPFKWVFVVDTGADFTDIPRSLAESIGLDVPTNAEHLVTVQTAAGKVDVPFAQVRLRIPPLRHEFDVVAFFSPREPVDDATGQLTPGLLGLNVLGSFFEWSTETVQVQRGVRFTLRDKETLKRENRGFVEILAGD